MSWLDTSRMRRPEACMNAGGRRWGASALSFPPSPSLARLVEDSEHRDSDVAPPYKYKGRAPTARVKAPEVKRLREAGVGASEIARKLGIGRASVYRILDAEGV